MKPPQQISPDAFLPEARLEELSRLGSAIYETKLKAKLEPDHDKQFVAHPVAPH